MKNSGRQSSSSPSSSSSGFSSPDTSRHAQGYPSSPATTVASTLKRKNASASPPAGQDDDLIFLNEPRKVRLRPLELSDDEDIETVERKPRKKTQRIETPEQLDTITLSSDEEDEPKPPKQLPLQAKKKESAPKQAPENKEASDQKQEDNPRGQSLTPAAPTPAVPKRSPSQMPTEAAPPKRARKTRSSARNEREQTSAEKEKPQRDEELVHSGIIEGETKAIKDCKKLKKDLKTMEAAAGHNPRPEAMERVNLLDPTTCEGDFWYKRTDDVEELLAESPFYRVHIPGPPVATKWLSSTPARKNRQYGDDMRICVQEEYNLGEFEAGKPFTWVTSARSYLETKGEGCNNKVAVFMQRGKAGETWSVYGWYELVWCGTPDDGEFIALRLSSPEKAERVVDMLMHYVYKQDGFSRFVFEKCFVDNPDDPLQPLNIRDERVSKETKRARIVEALVSNDGSLQHQYALLRFVGINRKELTACREVREEYPQGKIPAGEGHARRTKELEAERGA